MTKTDAETMTICKLEEEGKQQEKEEMEEWEEEEKQQEGEDEDEGKEEEKQLEEEEGGGSCILALALVPSVIASLANIDRSGNTRSVAHVNNNE